MKKFYLLFIVATLYSSYSQSQEKIDCAGVNILIPFREDSVFSEMSQILLEKKVLVPIRESESSFEIRIHGSPYNMPGSTTVIQCKGDKILATRYFLAFTESKKPLKYRGFTSLGPTLAAPELDVLYKKGKARIHGLSWNEFFDRLVANRFFDSISELELKKIITKAHPNIQEGIHQGPTYVQIKVGKRFRNMIFSLDYNPSPLDIPEYRQRRNVDEILNQIY